MYKQTSMYVYTVPVNYAVFMQGRQPVQDFGCVEQRPLFGKRCVQRHLRGNVSAAVIVKHKHELRRCLESAVQLYEKRFIPELREDISFSLHMLQFLLLYNMLLFDCLKRE